MNRVTRLWRSYKKNQKEIGKIIRIVLTCLVVIGVGLLVGNIIISDIQKNGETTDSMSESPIEADTGRDYGEPGLKVVAENAEYILYADTTNGEIAVENKRTGYTLYSNPPDRESDTYTVNRYEIESQLIIECMSIGMRYVAAGGSGRNSSTTNGTSAYDSVRTGGLDYELIENGIRFTYTFSKFAIRIPVQYTITEEGFVAEIVSGEIEELWQDRYVLLKIQFLPFFGAGGVNDEGYLFVPDGSGALIYYNNNKQRFAQYTARVYGRDYVTVEETAPANTEQATMPVFGLKTNENAMIAIVASGDAYSEIIAYPGKKLSGYNRVYSKMIYRDSALDDTTTDQDIYEEFTEPLMQENYRIEYYMLEDDEADYAGMAAKYRSWLIANGQLYDSVLADQAYMTLNLYGAVSIEKYVVGIKQPVVTALTTYQDVISIVKTLKENGVENLIINYIGAMDGGLNAEMMDRFKTESALGSKKDFEAMKAYLEQENVLLFIEEDPINLYRNGNGYGMDEDAVLAFFDQFAYQYQYSLNLKEKNEEERWTILKPLRVADVVSSYLKSAVKSGLTNYSAASLGTMLYSDYDEDSVVYRQESLSVWKSVLKSAAENFDYVMVEGGNAYTLPYVDVVRNAATSFSSYDLMDESVPFYQMVLSGSIAMCSSALNMSADYHYQFLKALETGCNLSYTWIAGNVIDLVGTEYDDLVSASFDYWFETAVEEYHAVKAVADKTAGSTIIGHNEIAEDVYETVYENGTLVYVNYSTSDYQYGDILIPASGYAVSE